ncbi:hypothetical protein [Burkholderia lata]|uniref:hypothetical protein n=1 Tax=Burkholderia lata (strain ATCC 17760 / DSM 23089 / LMG 22485 / NCIMB 9086 / R18194 / 383) TaxID=482957 RepID=UPI000A641D74|nr:hypothetical protein [Burkholderia lata]
MSIEDVHKAMAYRLVAQVANGCFRAAGVAGAGGYSVHRNRRVRILDATAFIVDN